MDEIAIKRALRRIAHEIIERNEGSERLAIVGIVTRGDILARHLAEEIAAIEGTQVLSGSLDISFYRDDFATNFSPEVHATDISWDVDGKRIVLVDDVLYTGRTIRAALDAIMDMGRPSKIELAVLVDRGHRELPISPDFVGKNVPSSREENVRLFMAEVDGRTTVEISQVEPGSRIGSAPLGKE
ncbi:bifunctional pyr operon transcriptional regulator/uracil phosphoribosyltransferase PyrR [Collinsella sp. zg1085]|nr:bifunctional pyr operon transcriptional regulator/uracil phosphoribosyltransferase PyrR [Collinsella sp. zg1085]